MEDWEKIIDTLDDNIEEDEFVDDWFCAECSHGPMGEADDECSRCGEPHPTLKKKTPVDEDGWGEEIEEVEEIY
jgi:rubrerythrin